jgi:putative transposase
MGGRGSRQWEGEAPAEPQIAMQNRKHPAHGLIETAAEFPIVFVTVCTKGRSPWLASKEVHRLLCDTWNKATTWLVGRYVIMPDHVHLFAAPSLSTLPLDNWIRYWKSQFTNAHRVESDRWQTDHWDTRLRSWDSYNQKWNYVRDNPKRHGLVDDAARWPYQGELNELRWD